MSTPPWAWIATVAVILALVTADIVLGRRKGTPTTSRAAALSAAWIAVSVAFGAVLGVTNGRDAAEQFFTGYVLEKLLSVDNIFVFAVLLAAFAVPRDAQRRVLSFGVLGALVMRGALIAGGSTLFSSVTWIFYVFGSILVVAGLRMLVVEHEPNPERNLCVRLARRLLPVSTGFHGDRFCSRSDSGPSSSGAAMGSFLGHGGVDRSRLSDNSCRGYGFGSRCYRRLLRHAPGGLHLAQGFVQLGLCGLGARRRFAGLAADLLDLQLALHFGAHAIPAGTNAAHEYARCTRRVWQFFRAEHDQRNKREQYQLAEADLDH